MRDGYRRSRSVDGSAEFALYGLGGLVLPFVGIKLIDLAISMVPGIG